MVYNDNMNNEQKEKYILVGVNGNTDTDNPLDELAALLDTAGGESVCKILQHLDRPDPATYVGRGKAEGLASLRT